MRDLHRGHPLWLVRRPTRTYAALKANLDVDVAVVGGGSTGATTAAVFSGSGLRVAVLEAGLIGMGSTVASTALLLREPDKGLTELGRRCGSRRARRIWELSGAARELRCDDP